MKFYFVGHYIPQAENFDGWPNIDKMKTNIQSDKQIQAMKKQNKSVIQ